MVVLGTAQATEGYKHSISNSVVVTNNNYYKLLEVVTPSIYSYILKNNNDYRVCVAVYGRGRNSQ